MLRFVVATRVGERYNLLRITELVVIQDNQTVVREVFAQLCRQTFERRILRDRTPAGRDNDE